MDIIPEYQSGVIGASPVSSSDKPITLEPMKKFVKRCQHCECTFEYTFKMTFVTNGPCSRHIRRKVRGLNCPECGMFVNHLNHLV